MGLAVSLVTVLLAAFATQMFAPSKAMPEGLPPTLNVPRFEPSEARSLVTLLPEKFATQMFAPSKARALGLFPTLNVPRFKPSEARRLVTVLSALFACAAGAMLTAFATNNRINVFLIRNLPDEAWRATPPGGKGRAVGSIAAHLHNVRLMWLKSIDKEAVLPAKLDSDTVTKEQAIEALEASFSALDTVIRTALAGDGRVRGFKPDVGSFLAYLFAHDAHHRGQIAMLARQVGHPLSQSAMFGLWEWGTR